MLACMVASLGVRHDRQHVPGQSRATAMQAVELIYAVGNCMLRTKTIRVQRAGKQASRQAGKQASRQAGKQASRQAGKQAS
ncbi:hypothetical protein VTJ83DRAFT_2028 [Remersonia thermophila]|uniref:Uncharacterized protein n=1 Tax=Remersonia thermophila TaxID=72144 RepID=A0ABR4DHR2_9PEZI